MISPMRRVIYIDSELFMPILIALFVGFWIWYAVSGVLLKRKGKREIARACEMEIAPGITLHEGIMAYFGLEADWSYQAGLVSVLAYAKTNYPYALFSVKMDTGEFNVPVFCPAQDVTDYTYEGRRNALLNALIQAVREQRGEIPW